MQGSFIRQAQKKKNTHDLAQWNEDRAAMKQLLLTTFLSTTSVHAPMLEKSVKIIAAPTQMVSNRSTGMMIFLNHFYEICPSVAP